MTLPRKNTRPIAVDAHDLRWGYVRQDTYLEAILIVQGCGKGQLKVYGPVSPEKGRQLASHEQVTPSVVEKWVRHGLQKGWSPAGDTHLKLHTDEWLPAWLDPNAKGST